MSTQTNYSPDLICAGYTTDITATEFELLVAEHITSLGASLPDFKIRHNAKLSAHDGVYQIDVLASYTALNVNMLVLIECKRHSYAIPRDAVQILRAKLHSSGAHKGIIFSTSGFQDGAIQYALKHRIGLVTVLPGKFMRVTNCLNKANSKRSASKFIGHYLSGSGAYLIDLPSAKMLIKDLICPE